MRKRARGGVGRRALLLLLSATAVACNCPSDKPGEGSSSGTGGGLQPLRLDAGANDGFTSLALTASGDEAELFLAQHQSTGGYQFSLQHLSPSGSPMGGLVNIGPGTPHNPPRLSIDSDGSEIALCWDDYGVNPSAQFPVSTAIVRCNSVRVGATTTDVSLADGFVDYGLSPSIAHNGSITAVVYAQAANAGLSQEVLYQPPGTTYPYPTPYVAQSWELVQSSRGFQVIVSDGGALAVGEEQANLFNDGGLAGVFGGALTGSFAAAASPPTTAVAMHQGLAVAATFIGTSSPELFVISSPDEQPIDPIAAAGCTPPTFGVAYADDGGDLMFREVSVAGANGTGATRVANLGDNVVAIGMAAVDGGLLLAAATPSTVAVYTVPCP